MFNLNRCTDRLRISQFYGADSYQTCIFPVSHTNRQPIKNDWHGHESSSGYGPFGGQSGAAVTCPHGNHEDVGSNPATARNEKTHNGQTPAPKVPQ